MADNLTLSPITVGGGPTIATDDVGGFHHQKVKLTAGQPDSAEMIPGDQTSGLYVQVRKNPRVAAVGTGTTDIAAGSPKSVPPAGGRVIAAAGRVRVELTNKSDASFYVNLGAAANSAAWHVVIEPGDQWWDDVSDTEVWVAHDGGVNKELGVLVL